MEGKLLVMFAKKGSKIVYGKLAKEMLGSCVCSSSSHCCFISRRILSCIV
jgi:hypothetical protein